MAGPDEDGHLDSVLQYAAQLGISDEIDYLGAVEGSEKAELLRGADLFVLPSFSENFGVVVAEALSYGVPVITTTGTPWKELSDNRLGWWVHPDSVSLGVAMREAMLLSDSDREEMGQRCIVYARRYNWDDIAKQTMAVYRWLLRLGDEPTCVIRE